jgi:methyl coenzyme M reductase gamma subunit
MNIKERHDFVFDYEFKLFTFPQFEIDGTSDGADCNIFIFDTKNNFELDVCFQNNKFSVRYVKDEINEPLDKDFDFCENFEEKLYEIYKEAI